jgi:hypothetical protein
MKWNWGTKLILVFGFFVVAMTVLVVMSMKQKIQLVAKDYYRDELRYQQVIDAASLANKLSTKVEIIKQGSFIRIQLPQEMAGTAVQGEILFYYISDAAKDRHLQLQTNAAAAQLIPLDKLLPGSYTVKINWTHNNLQYYTEQSLIL